MLNLDIHQMIYIIPALLIAITIHEYAHATVAASLGDPTPGYMGRLTMNPLAHLDIVGTILIVFVGFGWAKPVEINPSYFRNSMKGIFYVSAAGPLANIFLAIVSTILIAVFTVLNFHSIGVIIFLKYLQMYNIWFALFNLLPIPPLDGSKILMHFLPGKYAYEFMKIAPYSNIILILIIVSGFASNVLAPVASYITTYMNFFIYLIISIF